MKAWSQSCHSFHLLRPSHCPIQLNEQRRYNANTTSISCNIQNDNKTCVNANIYSI